jgi:hypothetical protein
MTMPLCMKLALSMLRVVFSVLKQVPVLPRTTPGPELMNPGGGDGDIAHGDVATSNLSRELRVVCRLFFDDRDVFVVVLGRVGYRRGRC